MKYSIPVDLTTSIERYNTTNGTNYGFSCGSLLALKQVQNNKTKKVEYTNKFEICKNNGGKEILKGYFENIISNDPNKNTIMNQIEETQYARNSRQSTKEHPLLFLVYLPTHTGNSTIDKLQETIIEFLKVNNLWTNFHVCCSNSSINSAEGYMKFVKDEMIETKKDNKTGCILLLGNQGTTGITYHNCDVTISLDDGNNLDSQKQRFSRALTETMDGTKTIGINVDMNIQRSYRYLLHMIHRHRLTTGSTKTYAEILYHLYTHNVFLFDPQVFLEGNMRTIDIDTYYKSEASKMLDILDDTSVLDGLVCDDDLRGYIHMDFQQNHVDSKTLNTEFEGEQQDCPKGERVSHLVDGPDDGQDTEKTDPLSPEEEEKVEELINQTYEMCKSFMFPLLALISRSYKIPDFKDIFTDHYTAELLKSLLNKKIEIKGNNFNIIKTIMSHIIDNNQEIVNHIREIYSTANANNLKGLIRKHFVPTLEEKKEKGEVHTSENLVAEMLNKMPLDFWKYPKTVFEPCCGKGGFVIDIFDKFWFGLEELIEDRESRCQVILDCIYFADISALNVFITTELLKCHYQSYCGIEPDVEIHSHIGDTLELDTQSLWGIKSFDAVIGNPPYSTDPSKPDSKPLYDKFIDKYIEHDILLFVVPSRWFVGGKGLDKFRDRMRNRKDIVFIVHEDNSKNWFGKNVEIKGGVNYFLKDKRHNGPCLFDGIEYDLSKYDTVIKPKYHPIIDSASGNNSINTIYMGRMFGVETNAELKEQGNVKCYVSTLKSKNRTRYLDSYNFNESNTYWKVITPEASFGAFSGFGEIFVGRPDEIHTGSYISFKTNNEYEANSLMSYLKTKFANHMLSIRKISQHINGDVCKWIPLLPLDRIWTDELVCEYIGIDSSMYM
jgi:site-specific DNA-methyltransferase (adenine-specific)